MKLCNTYVRRFLLLIFLSILFNSFVVKAKRPSSVVSLVKVYPAPAKEVLSQAYRVSASGKQVPVYTAKIGAADNVRRFKAVDDLMHSADYYDEAAFCYFDICGTITVTVSIDTKINSAKILPASAGIKPMIHQRSISFNVASPKNLTIEINGEWVKSLHIFVNPIETDVPNRFDSNVIYFGPGIHEVSNLVVGNNKTVYIAGGAIIRAAVNKDEVYGIEPSGLKNYSPTFLLQGRNIKFRGRGILDGSNLPTHARNFMMLKGNNIELEGIIFKNSSGWTVPVRQSNNVNINNIKLLGYRANTDGIDICNSQNVTVQNCFVRTNDDLIAIKTWEGEGPVNHVVVKNCVLWNQLAHALNIGAELRENINDVLFTDCDIIHDQGREWSLRIFQSDASLVSNIRFENLNIEESRQFISLWTGKNIHSLNQDLGTIRKVMFKNINVKGWPLTIDLIGGSEEKCITQVAFSNVLLNGKKLLPSQVKANAFVKNIDIMP